MLNKTHSTYSTFQRQIWGNQFYEIQNPVFIEVKEKSNIEKNTIKNKINSNY